MATVVTRYVNTASSDPGTGAGAGSTNNTSSGDNTHAFAKLSQFNAWLNANYADLTSADVQVTCLCTGGNDDATTTFTISAVTDATRYILIQANGSGQRAQASGWKTDRYRLTFSGHWNGLVLTTQCIRLDGLQIGYDYSAGTDAAILQYVDTGFTVGDLRLLGCRLEVVNLTACSNMFVIAGTGTSTIYCNNCILNGKANTITAFGIYLQTGGTKTLYCYNCTVDSCNPAFRRTGNTFNVTNTITTDCPYGGYWGTFTGDYNRDSANGDDPPPGANSEESVSFTFEDLAGGDYRLASGDTGAKNEGTDVSADAGWKVGSSIDIDGNTRAESWDIGAHEYEAAASGQPTTKRFANINFTPNKAGVWVPARF